MASSSGKYLHFVLLLVLSQTVFSAQNVTTLPGFNGTLPFTLETGYTTVGDIEFFYYFIYSENNPAADAILFYHNGGPGCSGLNGLFYQIGPLKFDIDSYTGGLPTLLYEPTAWSKTANILFIDSPVGTGFSYATTTDAWTTSDTLSAEQAYEFIKNWLTDHPNFQTNPIYLGSDSYAGIVIPMMAVQILEGNSNGSDPIVNLKGLVLSCPHADTIVETNSKVSFAHRLALISDEMYTSAATSCNGTYADVDPSNTECVESLNAIDECVELINRQNVLYPNCALLSPKEKEAAVRRSLKALKNNHLRSMPSKLSELYCNNYQYLLSDIWTNYKIVQDALGVRNGTITEFYRCNVTISYTVDVNTVIPILDNLTTTGLQVLVMSGDHDMVMPHNGIEYWIASFDLTIDTDWRPWFTDGQVAGYTRRYTNDGYRLTYATLKGAGHSPAEDKRKQCFDLFHRWIRYYPV